MVEIVKAKLSKRIFAILLDGILALTLWVGVSSLFDVILGYNKKLDSLTNQYGEEYQIKLDEITVAKLAEMDPEELQRYEEAVEELMKDDAYIKATQEAIISNIIAIVLSILLVDLLVPLLMKDGRTLGKKAFHLALIQKDGKHVRPLPLFIRCFVGRLTLELGFPLVVALLYSGGVMGDLAVLLFLVAPGLNLILLFSTKQKLQIHDFLAGTIVVDDTRQIYVED